MGTGFTVNAHRLRPVQELQVSVEWDNRIVANRQVGALKRTTEVVKHRHGGENSS